MKGPWGEDYSEDPWGEDYSEDYSEDPLGVGATGGVYKGQGRNQHELMTRAY